MAQYIKEEMNLFVSNYDQATKLIGNKSGQSEDDIQALALCIYKQNHKGVAFRDLCCWEALRGYPKWQSHMEYKGTTLGMGQGEGGDAPIEESGGSGNKQ